MRDACALEINWIQECTADLNQFISKEAVNLQHTSVVTFIQPSDDRGQRCKLTVHLPQDVYEMHVSSNARCCELYTLATSGEETYCSSFTGSTTCDEKFIVCLKVPVRSHLHQPLHLSALAQKAIPVQIWCSEFSAPSATGRTFRFTITHVLFEAKGQIPPLWRSPDTCSRQRECKPKHCGFRDAIDTNGASAGDAAFIHI